MKEGTWTLLAMDSGWDSWLENTVDYRLYYREEDGQYLLECNGVAVPASLEQAQEWYQRTASRMRAVMGLGAERRSSPLPSRFVAHQA